MIGTSVSRIDAELLASVDGLEHALDLGPAGKAEENFAAGPDIRQGREGFTWHGSAHDVDPRDDGAEVVRRSPDTGKDAAGREGQDAAAVENLLGSVVAEADPLLDPLLKPDQLDMCERVGGRRGHDAAHWRAPHLARPVRPGQGADRHAEAAVQVPRRKQRAVAIVLATDIRSVVIVVVARHHVIPCSAVRGWFG
jgi:hypothetical protein